MSSEAAYFRDALVSTPEVRDAADCASENLLGWSILLSRRVRGSSIPLSP